MVQHGTARPRRRPTQIAFKYYRIMYLIAEHRHTHTHTHTQREREREREKETHTINSNSRSASAMLVATFTDIVTKISSPNIAYCQLVPSFGYGQEVTM